MNLNRLKRYIPTILLSTITVIVTITFLIIFAIAVEHERKTFNSWITENECVVIGHMDGDVIPTVGIGMNGQPSIGVASTPSKTGYKCKDNKVYWK